MTPREQAVLSQVDSLTSDIVELTCALVRIPTVNPPGDCYTECATLLANTLRQLGYTTQTLAANGMPEHTQHHPRLNVIGMLGTAQPVLHFNGHYDVVPAESGWTRDPFGAEVCDGRIYGRGTCDQKAGIAASIYAIEAIRRTGVELKGSIEQSMTADEESGGFAGMAWLCERGYVSSERQRFVVITEPLDPERVCIGHRGVYWFEVTTLGRVGHGSMPGLAINAADEMAQLIQAINTDLKPRLASRLSHAPVEPPEARRPSINLNALHAGQALDGWQTPCVPDRCVAVFDRRFIHEEHFDAVKSEVMQLLDSTGIRYELRDVMRVDPMLLPDEGLLAQATATAINSVLGHEPKFIASPGTFDQKHVVRRAGIQECIGYGPGRLVLAHQPDEFVAIDDLIAGTKVMALLTLNLLT
ncbi:MAG TPA: acetylornithine deacetylase/succinyl-diaminopimelate desuccinylase family protein [Chloroflexota bacterium]